MSEITREEYLKRAGKPTPFFWSSAFKGTETLMEREATVTVRVFLCGCRGIHEHSDLANRRELDKCTTHKEIGGLPDPTKMLAIEYYA